MGMEDKKVVQKLWDKAKQFKGKDKVTDVKPVIFSERTHTLRWGAGGAAVGLLAFKTAGFGVVAFGGGFGAPLVLAGIVGGIVVGSVYRDITSKKVDESKTDEETSDE
jgi:hypothetical protein